MNGLAAAEYAATRTPGIIRDGEVLTVGEFKRRMGLKDHAFRQLCRAGLRLVKITAQRRVILSSDWIALVQKLAEQQAAGS